MGHYIRKAVLHGALYQESCFIFGCVIILRRKTYMFACGMKADSFLDNYVEVMSEQN